MGVNMGTYLDLWDVSDGHPKAREELEELQLTQKRYKKTIEKLETDNERMYDALQKIASWQKAYPLDVFPEPDLKRAHEILKVAGMTLDAISASNMRHVLSNLKEIVDAGLGVFA
jgi:cyanate lyase